MSNLPDCKTLPELDEDAPQNGPTLPGILTAFAERAAEFIRVARIRWSRRRQATSTRGALAELDDRTLHDLALDRSEIDSLAAEASGTAMRTRILARLT